MWLTEEKNTFQCTLRQYCVFKVFDVISLKCISLCAQMWDYGHTKKLSHSEKAASTFFRFNRKKMSLLLII